MAVAGTRVPLTVAHEERAGLHWMDPPNELPPVVAGVATDVGAGTSVPLTVMHELLAGLHWIEPPKEEPPVVAAVRVA